MKSTSLILSATVLFSMLATGQENYSLWPRRPAELEQAQRFIRQHDYEQALTLLMPFIHKSGLAGHEARHYVSAIRVRRYLSAQHPKVRTYTVRRGDNIERIATSCKSSGEVLTLINGLIDPSNLKVGQKLQVIPMDLRAELHLNDREISVWDGQTLVAAYDITPTQDLIDGGNEETQLRDREGEVNGARVPRSSALFTSCNRTLKLANGIILQGSAQSAIKPKTVHMQQKDVNELSLLLGVGARVSIVRDEKQFDPFETPAVTAPEPQSRRSGSKSNK